MYGADPEALLLRQRRSIMLTELQGCHRCERRQPQSPLPGKGPMPSDYMLIVDVPGAVNESNLPQLFKNHGLPSIRQWYIASAVKCGSMTPVKEDVHACLPNLRDEIRLVNPSIVVLMGVHALTAGGFGSNKLSQCHGRPFTSPYGPLIDRRCFPTFHPAVGYKDVHALNLLNEDLNTLYRLLNHELRWESVQARVGKSGKLNLTMKEGK